MPLDKAYDSRFCNDVLGNYNYKTVIARKKYVNNCKQNKRCNTINTIGYFHINTMEHICNYDMLY